MDFSIKALDLTKPAAGIAPPGEKASATQGGNFKNAMLKALQATSALQTESGRLSKEFSLDNPTVSLEETMIAGVKSSIAFQTTLQVRNKVVQAYTDIMNMQV
ncbi:flagellar hook-basal body complex protein FliE [Aquabacterium sp. J223]|uniref:flagellar hook-basal body complex protein FliE n=1 Tax=Aquabacterium sp. J223 TaxID=2898431 RepID=UPI0021AD855E|nr:flagellar hook-basal body complex protein FliE [Aquabacterium sp. J223]UUX96672.1 flagellar hook-basal body complex protein FliE [Aquabacterium sp. J223]